MEALGYYSTKIPELVVDISVTEYDDSTVRVKGIGVDPDSNIIYKELGTVNSKRVSRSRLTHQINYVRHEFELRYGTVYSSAPADFNLMQRAFDSLKHKVEVDHFRLKPQWDRDSTNLSAIKHFERNGLELLKPFADPSLRMFLDSDRKELEEAVVEKVMRRNGGKENSARVDAQNHLEDWELILKRMREIDPRIPEFKLVPDEYAKRVPPKEQIKYLPRPLLMQLYSMLRDMISSYPKMVFFAVLVIFGLRPAEAAACKPCDICWCNTYCTILIANQEVNGLLCNKLKNEYSRRVVIIPYWGMVLLRRCQEEIGEDYPHDNYAMHRSQDCSAWVKKMLVEIGVEEEYINEVGLLISNDDMDDDAILTSGSTEETLEIRSYKIACYVLRRVFTTIMRSEMGLGQYETDRLLGHIPLDTNGKRVSNIQHIDMNSSTDQAKIAQKMERFIFDENISLNPSCMPYSVQEEGALNLIEFSDYTISNDADIPMELDLNLIASECGERIDIELPINARESLSRHSCPKSWEDISRTVIGDTSKEKAFAGVK